MDGPRTLSCYYELVKELELLRELETTGKYLFHGTAADNIDIFEPRQAMSHGKNDGAPCIAASEYVDPAVFMAIFSGRVTCGWNSTDTSFGFYLKQFDYDMARAEGWNGFVYVFNRAEFKPYLAWEWRAHTKVKPLKKLEVSFEDLPYEIQLT